MISNSIFPKAFALAALLALHPGLGIAADETIAIPKQVILGASGETPIGLWPGVYGDSKSGAVERDASGGIAIKLNGPAARMGWHFNNHQKIKPGSLSGDPSLRFRLLMKSAADVGVELSFGWILEDGSLGEPLKTNAVLKTGESTEMLFPMPVIPSKEIAGLVVGSDKPLEAVIRQAEIVSLRHLALDSVPGNQLLRNDSLKVSGRATPGIGEVEIAAATTPEDGDKPVGSKRAKVEQGRFSAVFSKRELAECKTIRFTASVRGSTDPLDRSPGIDVFAYPEIRGLKLRPVTVKDGRLLAGGKPFGFVGLNYTAFELGLSNGENDELLARDAARFHDWGIRVVRICLNFGMIQPEEGVFPDNPQWKDIIRSHHLTPAFVDTLDYFMDLCQDKGIYTLIDWHEAPVGPYRYFVGGSPQDDGTGKPGAAIAWLCADMHKKVSLDLSNPKHLNALLSSHAWMARHLKGRTGVLGIEVPHNEPIEAYMAVQANWSRIVSDCCMAIKREDPDRLTFSQGANWAHDTEGWAYTWLNPFGLDGQGPHHYIANGPVPLRPDASKSKEPWMARDADKTFALSLPSLFFASMVWRQPIYNGEGGQHGSWDILPDLAPAAAADYMYEATLAQSYAAGLAGHLNWTLLSPGEDTHIYAKHGPRYAKLFAAGPVDGSNAEVALVQNTDAVEPSNGQNYSVVPYVDLFLSLHLGPVHYLPDDYLIFNGLSRRSEGLEQVSGSSIDLSKYKAVVVDTRNLDARVASLLKGSKARILRIDDSKSLNLEDLSAFLEQSGVSVDRKTPPGIQIAVGPRNILLYRGAGQGGKSRVYPILSRQGTFALIDEAGQVVFTGTSARLRENGFEVDLDKWRSLILEIRGSGS